MSSPNLTTLLTICIAASNSLLPVDRYPILSLLHVTKYAYRSVTTFVYFFAAVGVVVELTYVGKGRVLVLVAIVIVAKNALANVSSLLPRRLALSHLQAYIACDVEVCCLLSEL